MADLQVDHNLFRSADKLRQEGALLLEAAENVNTSGGRVVFSLQEIPLRRRFQTSNGNFLRRERADLVVLWAPHQSVSLKIPISNIVTTSNKDVFFWAQTQNDLLLFDDAKHLASAGAIVAEQLSGKQLEIRALTDLPIGIKYFTEHANIIQRVSANEIVLGDKTLYVNPPACEESTYTGDTSESLPSSDDEGGSFAGLDSRIKESFDLHIGVDELSLEQRFTPVKGKSIDDSITLAAQKKAKLLEDDGKSVGITAVGSASSIGTQSFPRATRCIIEGNGYHMDDLRFVYSYTGGIEGNSTIRWERSESGRAFQPIPNCKSTVYRPSLEDLGSEIRVAYIPVRADGVTGAIVYSNTIKIKLDPEVAVEVESNLALNTLMFKVLMRNGHEFQKRAILLTRHKLKLRKRRVSMAKAAYGRHITVAPSLEHDCHFALGLSNDEYYNFIAPSCYQRDIIVLTIQMFNEKERA